MTVEKTENIRAGDSIVMILYGRGGVGKTTFAATAPRPLLIDFENGTKYLGERGLNCDVIRMPNWFTHDDLMQLKGLLPQYDTIILDPIGEAMEKLMSSAALDGKKFRQSDGSLSMAGWGEAKRLMKQLVKWLRDAGKNVILIAHVAEGKDGEATTYRIQIATKLSDELPTMVDIISYMGVRKDADGRKQCVLYTPAQGGNYDSKDRTGRLPEVVPVSELHGWDDFKRAMGEAPKVRVSEVSAPGDDAVDWKQKLLDLREKYSIELQGKGYAFITQFLQKEGTTQGECKSMYDRAVNYLRDCGVRVA